MGPGRQLYRWSVSYADIPNRAGATIHARYFNYDQGIAIEAELRAAALDGDSNRVVRAEAIGHAVQSVFWAPAVGGYNLEAGIDQVFTSYSAWTSLGHLALYAADGDLTWLALARQSDTALASTSAKLTAATPTAPTAAWTASQRGAKLARCRVWSTTRATPRPRPGSNTCKRRSRPSLPRQNASACTARVGRDQAASSPCGSSKNFLAAPLSNSR